MAFWYAILREFRGVEHAPKAIGRIVVEADSRKEAEKKIDWEVSQKSREYIPDPYTHGPFGTREAAEVHRFTQLAAA